MRKLLAYAAKRREIGGERPLARRIGSLLGRARKRAIFVDEEQAAAVRGRHTADVVIVTALEEEHAAIVAALGCETHRGVIEIAGLRIAVESLHGMGNVGAAAAATTLMLAWRADYLILVGITGGFESADVRPGDVVIPDQVVGYESSKTTTEGTLRRPEVYRPDFALLTAARAVDPADWSAAILTPPPEPGQAPRIRFGTVLSGEKVVADAVTAADLRKSWPKAVAIEMESFGSALAMYRNGGRFLMVKGVSDLADADKNDRWRAYAAEVAARFTHAVLRHIPRGPAAAAARDLAVSGPAMLSICWALVDDWRKLAYYFQIPRQDQVRFAPGDEPMRVWDWLAVRRRLHELPAALVFIGRGELAEELLRAAAGRG